MKLNNYIFQSIGPYPILRSVVMAGIHQATHTPPDWQEGLWGYGERYGSDYGISLVSVTSRYALAEATRVDVMYYPCTCKSLWARIGHAVASVAIAHRGADGHPAFSLPTLVSPYIGTTTAVYGWYPTRYGAKDAFRMGNYGLLAYTGHNITMEFLTAAIHSKRHPWIAHLHLEDLAPMAPPTSFQ